MQGATGDDNVILLVSLTKLRSISTPTGKCKFMLLIRNKPFRLKKLQRVWSAILSTPPQPRLTIKGNPSKTPQWLPSISVPNRSTTTDGNVNYNLSYDVARAIVITPITIATQAVHPSYSLQTWALIAPSSISPSRYLAQCSLHVRQSPIPWLCKVF